MSRALQAVVRPGPKWCSSLVWARTAQAAQFTPVTDFGDNPGDLEMYAYVPDNVTANPPIVVASHWCTGSAQNLYDWLEWDELAEQYGYIVVYPSVTRASKCFDVASQASLTGTGGDSVSIPCCRYIS